MKSLNFPMMFESMSTEQSIVNQGTIAHPMLHNRAERTTDFALALQQLFENQDSVELVELELASIAQWDDELSQLLHAEEWRKDDWDVLTQWVASLVPLTQENIDWMHEYAHTLSLLAERVELEQQRLYERTEHLTSGQDGGSMQIKQADQPVQHEAKTAQPFYSLLNQSQANDPQGQDERSVVQLLQTLQKVAVE